MAPSAVESPRTPRQAATNSVTAEWPQTEELFDEVFSNFDSDGVKRLKVADLRAFVTQLGEVSFDAQNLEQLRRVLDQKSSGTVSYGEAKRFWAESGADSGARLAWLQKEMQSLSGKSEDNGGRYDAFLSKAASSNAREEKPILVGWLDKGQNVQVRLCGEEDDDESGCDLGDVDAGEGYSDFVDTVDKLFEDTDPDYFRRLVNKRAHRVLSDQSRLRHLQRPILLRILSQFLIPLDDRILRHIVANLLVTLDAACEQCKAGSSSMCSLGCARAMWRLHDLESNVEVKHKSPHGSVDLEDISIDMLQEPGEVVHHVNAFRRTGKYQDPCLCGYHLVLPPHPSMAFFGKEFLQGNYQRNVYGQDIFSDPSMKRLNSYTAWRMTHKYGLYHHKEYSKTTPYPAYSAYGSDFGQHDSEMETQSLNRFRVMAALEQANVLSTAADSMCGKAGMAAHLDAVDKEIEHGIERLNSQFADLVVEAMNRAQELVDETIRLGEERKKTIRTAVENVEKPLADLIEIRSEVESNLMAFDEYIKQKTVNIEVVESLDESLESLDECMGVIDEEILNTTYHEKNMLSGNVYTARIIQEIKRMDLAIASKHSWRDWNEEMQTILDRSEKDPKERYDTHFDIYSLGQDFVDTAQLYGQVILAERNIPWPSKTIQPASVGGLAGGQKFVHANILFKFSEGGGIYETEESAMKVANHELKGAGAFARSGVTKMRGPMMCIIDFRGSRLTAMSMLPISGSMTLKYGSADGGITVHNQDPSIEQLMRRIGDKLNICGHPVHCSCCNKDIEIYGPCDIECHQGKDNRIYALDFSRVFPPEPPAPGGDPYAFLYRMLRPELVKALPRPISSDAFSMFASPETRNSYNQPVREAYDSILMETRIPAFVRWLMTLNAERVKNFGSTFIQVLHREGINVRMLGVLERKLFVANNSEVARQMILTHMTARAVKNILRARLRETATSENYESYYRSATIHFLNEILKRKSNVRTMIRAQVLSQFPRSRYDVEILPEWMDFAQVFAILSQMTGIVLSQQSLEMIQSRSKSVESNALPMRRGSLSHFTRRRSSHEVMGFGPPASIMRETSEEFGGSGLGTRVPELVESDFEGFTTRMKTMSIYCMAEAMALKSRAQGIESTDYAGARRLEELAIDKLEETVERAPDDSEALSELAAMLRQNVTTAIDNDQQVRVLMRAIEAMRMAKDAAGLLKTAKELQQQSRHLYPVAVLALKERMGVLDLLPTELEKCFQDMGHLLLNSAQHDICFVLGDDWTNWQTKAISTHVRLLEDTELDVADSGMHHKAVYVLIEGMMENRKITVLNLAGNPIPNEGGFFLQALLERNKSITDLNLANCSLDDHSAGLIASSLEANDVLKRLNMSSNDDIGTIFLDRLHNSLLDNQTLEELTLDNTSIPINTDLFGILKSGPLKKFCMRGTDIVSDDVRRVGAAAALGKRMESITIDSEFPISMVKDYKSALINLTKVYMTDNSCILLSQYLRQGDRKSLKEVNMSGGHSVTDAGATAIAQALKMNGTIADVAVRMPDSGIGISGAIELGKIVGKFKSLALNCAVVPVSSLLRDKRATKCLVSRRAVNDEGCAIYAAALARTEHVETVQFYQAGIGDDGATALADALRLNKSITELNLTCNSVGDSGATALADSLRLNQIVKKIDLGDNPELSDAGATVLADALSLNKTLAELNMRGCNLHESGYKALQKDKRVTLDNIR